MFRWPLLLTPLSLGSAGVPREATLEITPRAAAFTLAALSHVGHAAHLALIDAHLKGQVRLTATAEIGQDSRTVAVSLAAPLVAAAELGLDHLTLADLIQLPRDLSAAETADPAPGGGPTRSPDCARMLLRAANTWRWVRGAERFEVPGCLGPKQPGVGTGWHDVIAELPRASDIASGSSRDGSPAPIAAEVRAPSLPSTPPDAALVSALRALALARFGRASLLIRQAVDSIVAAVPDPTSVPLALADVRAETADAARHAMTCLKAAADPDAVVHLLAGPIHERRPVLTALVWHGHTIEAALTPDPDGYQTLGLLPPSNADPATLVPLMLDVTRAIIEALIGRPLAEHRSDPIALSLRLNQDGQERVVTLHVGDSVVIVRNQVVFTAWVGSDGRAMLKLFPPEGMPTR